MAMMLKARTLLSVLVLFASAPAVAQSVAAPYTSATRYDIAGRVTGTISASASGNQGPFLATRNTYDPSGNVSTTETGHLAIWQDDSIAPANWGPSFTPDRTTSYTYDSYGRKTKEQLYAGAIGSGQIASVTQYSYDLYGRVVCTAVRMDPSQWGAQPDACAPQIGGPNGDDRITKTSYDYLGDVTVIQRAFGTQLQQNYETYTWNTSTGGAGKPETVADANGNLTRYTYGGTALNLLTQWNFPSPTTTGQSSSTDYEFYVYDANGNRKSLRKRDGATISYEYDALNRVTQKTVPASASGAAGYSIFYDYDLGGRQLYARFGSAAGPGITNSYDGFGQLRSASTNMDGVSRTISYGYDANSNQTSLSISTGYFLERRYDGLDRPKALVQQDGTVVATFSYDAGGRREGTGFGPGSTTSSAGYLYDDAGRLQTLTDSFNASAGRVLTLGYNPAHQIVSRASSNDNWAAAAPAAGTLTYRPNGLNQYGSVSSDPNSTGNVYVYDANGNLTDDAIATYVYDSENKLVSRTLKPTAAQPNPQPTTLSYDPNGRLWQTASPSGTSRFLWDGDKMVEEYDGAGTRVAVFGHGLGADEPLIAWDGTNGWARRYLHSDHQGSITAIADDNGTALLVNAYDPWGVPKTGNAGRFGYTGQMWLPDLGMWYYKARIYSPMLGRFLQTDPIGYKDQINLYAYVGNDPVDGRDPTGLCYDTKQICHYSEAETRHLLNAAYREATAGPVQGLINIKDNSTGKYDFSFRGFTKNDTWSFGGRTMKASEMGNFIAGFQAAAYDKKYTGGVPVAQVTVEATGVGYHLTGRTRAKDDPFDLTGMPDIKSGEAAGMVYTPGATSAGPSGEGGSRRRGRDEREPRVGRRDCGGSRRDSCR